MDAMDLKEMIELGAFALSLLVGYCEGRGAFVPLDIFNEKRHPIVEVCLLIVMEMKQSAKKRKRKLV